MNAPKAPVTEGAESVDVFATGPSQGRLRIIDLCYSVFMRAKGKNDEDGGPTDWFTDTLPMVEEGIAKLKDLALIEQQAEELRRRGDALKPFADLVDNAIRDGEPLNERGECFILIYGDTEAGDIDLADLHAAWAALQPPPPASEGQIGGGE